MGVQFKFGVVLGVLLGISFPGSARADSALCCTVASSAPHEWVLTCPQGIQAKVRGGAGHKPAALIRLPGAFEAPTDIGTYFTPTKEAAVVRGEFAKVSVELIALIQDRTPLIAISLKSPHRSGTTLVDGDNPVECLTSQQAPELASIVSQTGLTTAEASGAAAPAELVYDRLFGGL